jgi:hypothetical protein
MGCPPCNNSCPPAAGGYYPQTGAIAPGIGMDPSQTAFAPTSITPTAYAPSQSAYAGSSMATLPGTIPGPTIMYQNAMAPVNSLPTY